jgi:5'-nucleotidase
MLILVTNDDGYTAPGLLALARELKEVGDVVIAAPSTQKSAISSSLTLYTPLMAHHRRENGTDVYAVDGTPADAVKLAVRELLPDPPDVVVSGINFGLNTGSNILYSGTVAGALEGAQLGIPSYAVSLEVSQDPKWSMAARLARKLIQRLMRTHPKDLTVFNLNIPSRPVSRMKGPLVTVQEETPYEDAYDRREDPRGRTYYWLKGTPERKYRPENTRNGQAAVPTDAWAVSHGYVSVTPLRRDLTHHRMLEQTKRALGGRGK